MNQLWLYITAGQNNLIGNHGDGLHGDVAVDGLVSLLVGPLSEYRHSLVRKVRSDFNTFVMNVLFSGFS